MPFFMRLSKENKKTASYLAKPRFVFSHIICHDLNDKKLMFLFNQYVFKKKLKYEKDWGICTAPNY